MDEFNKLGYILPNNYYILNIFPTSELPSLIVKKYQKLMTETNSTFDNNSHNYDKLYDAGIDLFCPNNLSISNGSLSNKVDLGVKTSMIFVSKNVISNEITYTPCGYYLYPRSSTGSKTPLRLSNSIGVIDSGYRGNLIACFDNIDYFNNINSESFKIDTGSRLVQICSPNITYPTLINIVDSRDKLEFDLLKNNTRLDGGFGSTGAGL